MLNFTDPNFLSEVVADAVAQAYLTAKTDELRNRWVNAIAKAFAKLTGDTTFYTYQEETKSLLIWSDSNEIYTANGICQCQAFLKGEPCYHRAMARIVRNYFELQAKPGVPNGIDYSGISCGENCGHSDREHRIFDAGLLAGTNGQNENVYTGVKKDIWLIGYSVGRLNRKQSTAH